MESFACFQRSQRPIRKGKADIAADARVVRQHADLSTGIKTLRHPGLVISESNLRTPLNDTERETLPFSASQEPTTTRLCTRHALIRSLLNGEGAAHEAEWTVCRRDSAIHGKRFGGRQRASAVL